MKINIMQCCGSGMFIPDPDFLPFRFPDPTRTKKRKGQFFCPTFLCCQKFHKIENYFFVEKVQKNLSDLTKLFSIITPKNWDPGSGKNLSLIAVDRDVNHEHLVHKTG
jgi:hypothetical protein